MLINLYLGRKIVAHKSILDEIDVLIGIRTQAEEYSVEQSTTIRRARSGIIRVSGV